MNVCFKISEAGDNAKSIAMSMTNKALSQAQSLGKREYLTLLEEVELIGRRLVASGVIGELTVDCVTVDEIKYRDSEDKEVKIEKVGELPEVEVVFSPSDLENIFLENGSGVVKSLEKFFHKFRAFFRRILELLSYAMGKEYRPKPNDVRWLFGLLNDLRGAKHIEHVTLRESATKCKQFLRREGSVNENAVKRIEDFEKQCKKLEDAREGSNKSLLSYHNSVVSKIEGMNEGDKILLPMGVFLGNKWSEFPVTVKRDRDTYTIRILSSDPVVESLILESLGGMKAKKLSQDNLVGLLFGLHRISLRKELSTKVGALSGLLSSFKKFATITDIPKKVGVTNQLFLFAKKKTENEWLTIQFASECETFLELIGNLDAWIGNEAYRADALTMINKLQAGISERLKLCGEDHEKIRENLIQLDGRLAEVKNRITAFQPANISGKAASSTEQIKGNVSLPPICAIPKTTKTVKSSGVVNEIPKFDRFPKENVTPEVVQLTLKGWNEKLKVLQNQKEYAKLHDFSLILAKQLPVNLHEIVKTNLDLFNAKDGISYQLMELGRFITFANAKLGGQSGENEVDRHDLLAIEHIKFVVGYVLMESSELNQELESLVGAVNEEIKQFRVEIDECLEKIRTNPNKPVEERLSSAEIQGITPQIKRIKVEISKKQDELLKLEPKMEIRNTYIATFLNPKFLHEVKEKDMFFNENDVGKLKILRSVFRGEKSPGPNYNIPLNIGDPKYSYVDPKILEILPFFVIPSFQPAVTIHDRENKVISDLNMRRSVEAYLDLKNKKDRANPSFAHLREMLIFRDLLVYNFTNAKRESTALDRFKWGAQKYTPLELEEREMLATREYILGMDNLELSIDPENSKISLGPGHIIMNNSVTNKNEFDHSGRREFNMRLKANNGISKFKPLMKFYGIREKRLRFPEDVRKASYAKMLLTSKQVAKDVAEEQQRWAKMGYLFSRKEIQAIYGISLIDSRRTKEGDQFCYQYVLNTFVSYPHFFDHPELVDAFERAVLEVHVYEGELRVQANKAIKIAKERCLTVAKASIKDRKLARAATIYRLFGEMNKVCPLKYYPEKEIFELLVTTKDPMQRAMIAKEYLVLLGNQLKNGGLLDVDENSLEQIYIARFALAGYPLEKKLFGYEQKTVIDALIAYSTSLFKEKYDERAEPIVMKLFKGCQITSNEYPRIEFTKDENIYTANFIDGSILCNGKMLVVLPDIIEQDPMSQRVITSSEILYGHWIMEHLGDGRFLFTSEVNDSYKIVLDRSQQKERVDFYRPVRLGKSNKVNILQYARFLDHESYLLNKNPYHEDIPVALSKKLGTAILFANPSNPKKLFIVDNDEYVGEIDLTKKGDLYTVSSITNSEGYSLINIQDETEDGRQFSGLEFACDFQIWGTKNKIARVDYPHLVTLGGKVYGYKKTKKGFCPIGDENSVLQPKGKLPHVEKEAGNKMPILPKGFTDFDLIKSLNGSEKVVLAPRQYIPGDDRREELLWDRKYERVPYESGAIRQVLTFSVNPMEGFLESDSSVGNLYLAYLFSTFGDYSSALRYLDLAHNLDPNDQNVQEIYNWVFSWGEDTPNAHAFKAHVLIHQAQQLKGVIAEISPDKSPLKVSRIEVLEVAVLEMNEYFKGCEPTSDHPIDKRLVLSLSQMKVAHELLKEAAEKNTKAKLPNAVHTKSHSTSQGSSESVQLGELLYLHSEPDKKVDVDYLVTLTTTSAITKYFYQLYDNIRNLSRTSADFYKLSFAIYSYPDCEAKYFLIDKLAVSDLDPLPLMPKRSFTTMGRKFDILRSPEINDYMSNFPNTSNKFEPTPSTQPPETQVIESSDVLLQSNNYVKEGASVQMPCLPTQKIVSTEETVKPITDDSLKNPQERLENRHVESTTSYKASVGETKTDLKKQDLTAKRNELLTTNTTLKNELELTHTKIQAILKPKNLQSVYMGKELPLPISRLHGLWQNDEINVSTLTDLGFNVGEKEVKELNELVENQISLTTQIHHCKNQIAVIGEAIDSFKGSSSGSPSLISRAEKIINQKRVYPENAQKELLLVEYYNGFMTRSDQVNLVSQILNEKNKVLELPMGAGKTSVVLPIAAKKRANGENLVTLVVPDHLIEINKKEMGENANKMYGQKLHTFMFNPKFTEDVTYEALLEQYKMLLKTRESKGFILTSKRSLLSYRNYFVELLSRSTTSSDEELKQTLEVMSKTLYLFQNFGEVIADEIHEVLDVRKEVNKAISIRGESLHINSNIIDTTTKVFETILNKSKVLSEALLANLQEEVLSPKIIQEELEKLADDYITEWDAEGVNMLKDFILGKGGEDAVSWVKSSSRKEEILTVKAVLAEALPYSLQKTAMRQYGRSGIFTIPYERGKPQEGSEFDKEIEKLVYTLQDYICIDVSREGLLELVENYLKEALEQVRLQEETGDDFVDLDSTGAGYTFQNKMKEMGLGSYKLSTFYAKKEGIKESAIVSCLKEFNLDPKSRVKFCSQFVLPKIRVMRSQVRANSRDLVSMFHSFGGTTGTNWAKDSYHERIQSDKTSSIDGKTYALFEDMQKSESLRPKISWATISESGDMSDTLLRASKFGSPANVFIDSGGYLKGASARDFVLRAMKIAKQNKGGTDFEGAIYPNDKGQLVFIRPGEDQAQPLSSASSIPKEKLMMLYTEPFCTGTDVKHYRNAEAVVTVGKNTTTKDLFQAMWRMRQLGENQRIHFLVSEEMRESFPKREIGWEEIFALCRVNQAKLEGEYNYTATVQQLAGREKAESFKEVVEELATKEDPNYQKMGEQVHGLISVGKESDFFDNLALPSEMQDPLVSLEKLVQPGVESVQLKPASYYPEKVSTVMEGSAVEVSVDQQMQKQQSTQQQTESFVQLEVEQSTPYNAAIENVYFTIQDFVDRVKSKFTLIEFEGLTSFNFSINLISEHSDITHPNCPPINRVLVLAGQGKGQEDLRYFPLATEDMKLFSEISKGNYYIISFGENSEGWISVKTPGIETISKEARLAVVQLKVLSGITFFKGEERNVLNEWVSSLGNTVEEREEALTNILYPDGDDPHQTKEHWKMTYYNSVLYKAARKGIS